MGFNPDGTFSRDGGADRWRKDAATDVKIRADLHDDHDNDICDSLDIVMCKDGRSIPTANLKMGGFKLTGLGDPTAQDHAANKKYVDTLPGWTTSKNISGVDAQGRLNFTGLTGVNGITWTGADLAWVAKIGVTGQTSDRLVLNDAVAVNGNDRVALDENGYITFNQNLLQNLSWDKANSQWRTINPGLATLLQINSGSMNLQGLDQATITSQYQPAPLRTFLTVNNSGGSPFLALQKTASAKTCYIQGRVGTTPRWMVQLGDATAESGTRKGSDFVITRYDNNGANPLVALRIYRETGVAEFGEVRSTNGIYAGPDNGTVTIRPDGPTSTTGELMVENSGDLQMSGDNIEANGALLIVSLKTAGDFYWRPQGEINTTGEMRLDKDGNLLVTGAISAKTGVRDLTLTGGNVADGRVFVRPLGKTQDDGMVTFDEDFVTLHANSILRAGHGIQCASSAGAYATAYSYNINFVNGQGSYLYINGANQGLFQFQSDYRFKRHIEPLGSMWSKVKALNPVAYEPTEGDDQRQRWGFLAHELQETLTSTAANGRKDDPDEVQSPNPWTVLAALTSALQEAMARIEALEAA